MTENRTNVGVQLLRLLLASTALMPVNALAQSNLQGLGTLGGSSSFIDGYGHAISADGSVIVGYSDTTGNAGQRAFRWSGGAMIDLGTFGGSTKATGVSADGNVVVGESYTAGNTARHAFRWSGGTMTDLGTLGGTNSTALGVSANGSVVVGFSFIAGDTAQHAFRWSGGTMTDLGTLGGTLSQAMSVSADGSVVVGLSAITGDATQHAFLWSGGSMTDLGTLGGTYSSALGVSANGRVVVGISAITGDAEQHAFRWSGGTMTDLGTLGGTASWAGGVSADGNVVVGSSFIAGNVSAQAFRWTAANGMQSISTLLTSAGVNLGSWRLNDARAVSANGSLIVGNGINPNGNNEVWIARLCDLPGSNCGLITMSNQKQSFASLGAVGQTASASLATSFATATQQATQGGTSDDPWLPYSLFAAFTYDTDPTVTGSLGGTAKINDKGLMAGAMIAADYIRTENMQDGGSAKMNAGTFTAFLAQAPETGWQSFIGGNAIYLDGQISRGYLNGASPVRSTGSTNGAGYGLKGRIGYTFFGWLPQTKITPFASYTYSHVTFAGYRETDGPFPAIISSFHDIQQVSRIGADARYTFKPGVWMWGTVAWGHRLDAGKSADVSGSLIGLFSVAVNGGATTRRDWAEVTAGFRYGLERNSAITASFTANIPDRGAVNYVAKIVASRAF